MIRRGEPVEKARASGIAFAWPSRTRRPLEGIT